MILKLSPGKLILTLFVVDEIPVSGVYDQTRVTWVLRCLLDHNHLTSLYLVTHPLAADILLINGHVWSHSLLEPDSLPLHRKLTSWTQSNSIKSRIYTPCYESQMV